MSATKPARPLTGMHQTFYKGFSGEARSRKQGQPSQPGLYENGPWGCRIQSRTTGWNCLSGLHDQSLSAIGFLRMTNFRKHSLPFRFPLK